MPRIEIPTPEETPEGSKPFLDGIQKRFGMVPNVFKMASHSPAVLGALVSMQGPLQQTLDVKTRDAIALAVSQRNSCDYCMSAHTFFAKKAKISDKEIVLHREGEATDPKIRAAVKFAAAVTEKRGHVSNQELADVYAAGYSTGEIMEILSLAVQYLWTNFMNNVAETAIDFPVVKAVDEAA
jgi:uncharacterized peroxidase-related enzyme